MSQNCQLFGAKNGILIDTEKQRYEIFIKTKNIHTLIPILVHRKSSYILLYNAVCLLSRLFSLLEAYILGIIGKFEDSKSTLRVSKIKTLQITIATI